MQEGTLDSSIELMRQIEPLALQGEREIRRIEGMGASISVNAATALALYVLAMAQFRNIDKMLRMCEPKSTACAEGSGEELQRALQQCGGKVGRRIRKVFPRKKDRGPLDHKNLCAGIRLAALVILPGVRQLFEQAEGLLPPEEAETNAHERA